MSKVILMNFSGMTAEEGFSPEGAAVLDFTALEGTSLYCDDAAADAIRKRIAGLPAEGIHWIDTGDYHYLSLFWLEKISEPFELILFDNHPDDQPTAFGEGLLSCGSWVAEARRRLPCLKSCIWIKKTSDFKASEGLPVYLSIDKDVLSEDYARTDWDQGSMTIDELLALVCDISSHRRIIGIDICGGKTISKGATATDLSINLSTDLTFLDNTEQI